MNKSKVMAAARKVMSFVLAAALVLPAQAQTVQAAQAESIVPVDKFPIGLYWPPTPEYTTPEQYNLIQEAGINTIEVPNIPGYLAAKNDVILDLAAARGMKAFVPPPENMGANAMALNDEQLAEYVNRYKDHPGLGGYFIMDEPGDPLLPTAAHVYKKIAELDPTKLPHVNMLPFPEMFQRWVDLVGADRLNYLATDFYPYLVGGSVKPDYYSFLDTLRKTGLKNNVKTSNYLQSVGIENYLQRPTTGYLRHNVYTNLAYGVKSLTWFTWWSPGDTGAEKFTDAIMTREGVKTDLFEPVKQLNKEIKALGPTLLKLDAVNVYHSGGSLTGLTPVPANFFFKSNTNNQMVISHMVHSATGRNYIMVVSKNRNAASNFSFTLDPSWKIKAVTEVSKKTGKELPTNYDPATGNLTGSFAPGEGKLYAIDADFAYQYPLHLDGDTPGNVGVEPDYSPYENLARGKTVTTKTTYENDGFSRNYLLDGVYPVGVFPDGFVPGNSGWTSVGEATPDNPEDVTVNLGRAYMIDQVKLYPVYGAGYYPIQYTVQVSQDNSSWETVATVTERQIGIPDTNDPVIHEFEPRLARYVKISITESFFYLEAHAQLAEIEVYASRKTPLSVSSEVSQLIAGRSAALTIKRWNTSGQLEPVPANTELTFTSEQPSIATVDVNGVVTGVSTGTAAITVTAKDPDTQAETSATYKVTVLAFPAPWTADLIGNAAGGYQATSAGEFTINATGGGLDAGYAYIHQPLAVSAPTVLTATVNKLYQANEPAGSNGQAGLLIAGDSLDKRVFLSVNAAGKVSLTAGTNTITGDYVGFPAQLALVKNNNAYTGYYKKQGKWLPIFRTAAQSTAVYEAAGELEWGAASYSNSNALNSQAEFGEMFAQSASMAGVEAAFFYPQLPIASEQQIVIVATTADGLPSGLLPSGYSVAYASAGPKIATVSEEGVVQALAEGETTITVTVSNEGAVVSATELSLKVISGNAIDEDDSPVAGLPFEILEASFKNLDNEPVSELIGNDFIRAYATIRNKTNQDQTASIIAVLYAPGGAMANVSYLEQTVKAGESSYLNAGFALPAVTEGYELKLFVWDTINAMKPLSNAVTLRNEITP